MAVTTKPNTVSGAGSQVIDLAAEKERNQIGVSLLQMALQRIRRDKLTLAALTVVIVLVILSVMAPIICEQILHVDYARTNVANSFLPPGSVSSVYRPEQPLKIEANKIYTVFAIGNLGSGGTQGFMFDAEPLEAGTEGAGLVRFVNASPNLRTVDIYLDEEAKPVVSSLLFSKASKFIQVPEGARKISVRVGGMSNTEPPLFTMDKVNLAANVPTTAALLGMNGSKEYRPLEFDVFKTDLSAPEAGEARLQAIHALPNVGPVYIKIADEGKFAQDVQFAAESTGPVPAGDLDLRVIPSNAPVHILGTDDLGRDQLARLLYGGQVSLGIGFLSAFLSIAIGVSLGVLTGFYKGRVDDFIMWLITTIASIPGEFVLLIIAAVFRPTPGGLILVLGLLGWLGITRLVRGETLSQREREYIVSARSIGASARRIMFQHIAPNLLSVVLIALALDIAGLILAESALSFLGLGIQPPTPSWGNMLSGAQGFFTRGIHLVFPPGILISVTVLCMYIVGDGLRDAFDPTLKNR